MGPNLQFPADLVTFTEEIRYGKLHFLCSEIRSLKNQFNPYRANVPIFFNAFQYSVANVSILYPLKTPENLFVFSGGVKWEHLLQNIEKN